MKVVYADLLIITNLFFDYILLLLASRLCAQRPSGLRLLLASLAGAFYTLASYLEGFEFLLSAGGKILSCALVCIIAYYGRPNFARLCAAFAAVSAAMGGALWALGLSGGYSLSLCGAFCGISVTLYLFLGETAAPREAELKSVEIELLSRRCTLSAIRDTGNSLTDPVSGEHVIVVTPRAVSTLFPGCVELLEKEDSVYVLQYMNLFPESRGRFRLIPFKSLGQSGFVPAFRPDSLRVDGKQVNFLVAVSSRVHGELYEGII